MPPTRNYRMKLNAMMADRAALNALSDLPDYAPRNPAHSVATLTTLSQALEQALQNEDRAENAAKAAHDAVRAAQWALHDGLLGAKLEATAQYGNDSDAIQSLGLKKKSKWRRAAPRSPKDN